MTTRLSEKLTAALVFVDFSADAVMGDYYQPRWTIPPYFAGRPTISNVRQRSRS